MSDRLCLALGLTAFLSPSLAAMITHAPHRLARMQEEFVRRRMILAVTIAAALFGVVAAPAVAENSESAAGGAR